MTVSAKVEYACVAVLELSACWDQDEPVRIRDIADRHGIPSRFLVQILLQLKSAGLVLSTRGSTGGYILARAPDKISLGQVMGVVEGRSGEMRSNLPRHSAASQVLLETWSLAAAAQQKTLDGITFQDLMERVSTADEEMYYI